MIYKDGAKMSKSLGNVVTPEEINDKYGADTGRVFILFTGPPDQDAEWSDKGVEGVWRFLGRVWRSVVDYQGLYLPDWGEVLGEDVTRPHDEQPHARLPDAARALRRKTHQTLRAITVGIDTMHLNTAVSALMELINEVMPFAGGLAPDDEAGRAVYSEAVDNLVLVLSPFAPHLCDELRERLGHDTTAWDTPWPAWDEAAAAEESITIAVQVNGKLRDRLEIAAGISMDEAAELALGLPNVQRHLEGKEIRQVIKVPGRLINILVN